MSVKSQLENQGSPVRQFFEEYEDRVGRKECLALLQSNKPFSPPLLESPSRSYYYYVGITIEYLIRYITNNNSLDFENTKARSGWIPGEARFVDQILFENVAQAYLDGRKVDELAVYSATALAMLDSLRRSGMLPQSFSQEVPDEKISRIKRLPCGSNIDEKTVLFLFDEYCFDALSWEFYVQDVLTITSLFVDALNNPTGDLYQSKFVAYNQVLAGSAAAWGLGAEFDCVIQQNGRQILTDIKTTIRPLNIGHLRQLIVYALFHDELLDGLAITDVGIYSSRAGSFRYLPIEDVIKKCMPAFKSIAEAKERFFSEVTAGYPFQA